MCFQVTALEKLIFFLPKQKLPTLIEKKALESQAFGLAAKFCCKPLWRKNYEQNKLDIITKLKTFFKGSQILAVFFIEK